jgi:hypothetical protein
VSIIATQFRVRTLGEVWAFFATLVGAIAAAGTALSSVYQFTNEHYLATHPAPGQQAAATFDAPSPVNPLGVTGFASDLVSIPYLFSGTVPLLPWIIAPFGISVAVGAVIALRRVAALPSSD